MLKQIKKKCNIFQETEKGKKQGLGNSDLLDPVPQIQKLKQGS